MKPLHDEVAGREGDVSVVRVAISFADARKLYLHCGGEGVSEDAFIQHAVAGDVVELNTSFDVQLVTPGLPEMFLNAQDYWVQADDALQLVQWISLYGICLKWVHGVFRMSLPPWDVALPYSTERRHGAALDIWVDVPNGIWTMEVEAPDLPEFLALCEWGREKSLGLVVA